jgi:hydroxymethylglutaryl-CoA lyase
VNLPSKITICEVGLRDGMQNEPRLFSTEEKISIANRLMDAGFKVIELGSFMSPKAVPQMANTDDVFKALGEVEGVELRALVANRRGVERAIKCGCKKVKLNVSASKAHNLANINMTPEESVSKFKESVDLALENGLEILGVKVSTVIIPVRPGRNTSAIIEIAAKNYRQKLLGFNPLDTYNKKFRNMIR